MEFYEEQKKNIKRCIHHNKREVSDQIGRKMNQDLSGYKSCFERNWKK